jgi:hypothetical protein
MVMKVTGTGPLATSSDRGLGSSRRAAPAKVEVRTLLEVSNLDEVPLSLRDENCARDLPNATRTQLPANDTLTAK